VRVKNVQVEANETFCYSVRHIEIFFSFRKVTSGRERYANTLCPEGRGFESPAWWSENWEMATIGTCIGMAFAKIAIPRATKSLHVTTSFYRWKIIIRF
jgi:hypothetical protein